MYVQVAVNIPQMNGVFDYHLPPELEGQVQAGCLVIVPFGRQTVQGIVLRPVAEPQVLETRPVEALLDSQPVLTANQLKLAEEMAHQSLAPLAVCLDLMLPTGLGQRADTLYRYNPTPPDPAASLFPTEKRMLERLREHNELRGRQLEAAYPHQNWKAAVHHLEKLGWVTRRSVLPPPAVRPKVVRTAQLACSPELAESKMAQLGRGMALTRRQAILQFLMKEPWPVEVTWVYASSGGNLADLQKLAEMELVTLGESEVWRDPLKKVEWITHDPPDLTNDQQAVWDALRPALQHAADGSTLPPYILHGVTGSGKTEIYLQAVAETLRLGRQAIVLVPEISLTPQTVQRFLSRFPGKVGLAHSALSVGERYDTWRRARAGQLQVIVGPRSALFSPLPDPGLIVIDECHDDSYYQSEGQPYYHTVETALTYARLANSMVILGSATPEVALIQRAKERLWPILHLPDRILAHRKAVAAQMSQLGLAVPALAGDKASASLPLPPVRIVDMRQELKAGNRSIFSRALTEAITRVLQAKQQAILFLNRRGSATYVFCRDCGTVLRCPRCDMPLTYHTDEAGSLRCHSCNYRRQLPTKCPTCGSPHIRQYGMGTEKVEQEVQAAFPQARTLRWDAETARSKGAHDLILKHFSNHNADILVGTQMLAKGLDLPLVTLVGVVLADVGLTFPDYRAGERAFQLLTQVAGRAGRSPLGGEVIFQTFVPDHYVIQAAAGHDFERFYAIELEFRRQMGYPPFSHLVRLEIRRQKAEEAEEAARRMSARIQNWIEQGKYGETEIIGPAPCFFGRVNSYYRWQIILRGPDPAAILRGRNLEDWRLQVDPPNLL